jgi:hypothetical protein
MFFSRDLKMNLAGRAATFAKRPSGAFASE